MENVNRKSLEDICNILLIGNNPIEMGHVLDKLKQVKGKRIATEIAFDIKSGLERLLKFTPNFILIDDNIGRSELMQTVTALSANHKTKNIPITVLKNSNYEESLASASILDYLLKQNLSPEVFYNAIKNSLKFKRAQSLLYKAYKTRKGQLMRLMNSD